ncbi:hypothetical protein HMPREF0494_0923 [Limosilactobacillus antri DSM 16041]|uniref:Uncharacterized protein n=1 Tax=Limosilactobacillus antri DSM 16041 TaxID=525309 RepID=C8P6H9_9LACO|nr:hypothetical protein HMPREF0494_0923 [Limosilactobacillus antri DSM 16041]
MDDVISLDLEDFSEKYKKSWNILRQILIISLYHIEKLCT